MNTKLKLAIAVITGVALIFFKRRKEKIKNSEQSKAAQKKSNNGQSSKPVGYRPFKDLAEENAPNIVALQNTGPQSFADGKHVPTSSSPQHIAYHPKGNRHH
ncbi:hypothetical protein [Sphingobacterium prati]|uniref:hypothetical protein n=1 Tax=Sphingobacterium prati TaxID=2737006 RepID=UPI001552687B|nr:hypothetical protein [Sphingobacterium prati]NPE46828.1 hypothetical protein [Sphingobacterium prati]